MSLMTPTLGVKTAHTPVATTMMTKIRWRNLTKKLALAVSTDNSVCFITCGYLHGTWWCVRHARESGQVRARLAGWVYVHRYTCEQQRRDTLSAWIPLRNHHTPHSACADLQPITQLTNVPEQYA